MSGSSLLGDDSSELINLSLASAECTETSLRHPTCLLVLAVSTRGKGIQDQRLPLVRKYRSERSEWSLDRLSEGAGLEAYTEG